ncbi:hypothetical protein Mtc_1142 [Methanocella conradii HZ254]|uniref:ABC-type transport system involved in multi-copper enzyme maturation, permease component n=1 Tax=Methanocella conradii (strain DSM 24694 / JCM 17849 / CGMCC 1.5162 / HZ254) TaxID=1041930 RepID=H8I7R3_METCZ|nr:ABC transporter permease subunit [Methanocella conradii]AFC99898.1 hypothetical protein Mtc_1142 [Methanocella conradii HZ254]MDI6897245.1 ABC transporter permease subunit [Methanocella conradii]
MNALLVVARNEFSMVARNPIIVLFMGLMVVYTLVNDLGVIGTIRGYDMPIDYARAILSDVGFVNPFMGGFFVLLTLCLGVVSIADERSKGSLGVMLAKPLYRRDLILGKLTGIAALLLLLMTITFVSFVSSLIVVYGNIGSMMEVIIRMSLFIFLLFAYCCFTLGVVALFSILFSKGAALVASLAYFCYEWYSYGFIAPSDPFFGALRRFDPVQIFWNPLINVKGSGLQDTALPLGEWINYSWPYITLLVLYVIIIMLVDSMIFNREEI